MACCHHDQCSSRPVPEGSNQCGAIANVSNARTANADGRRRFEMAVLKQVSSAGAAQTQWCDQDMGEISKPAAALSSRACVAWPVLRAPRMLVTARAATSKLRASQSQARAGLVRPTRARVPSMDWLEA